MHHCPHCKPPQFVKTLAVLFLCATTAHGQTSLASWDAAFEDRSGNCPLHLVARYFDAQGMGHRLEEWRVGRQHLRRRTDDRIDLHADAAGSPLPGQPAEYVWQILDLQAHIANRVSTAGMLHLGMLYSYYSMAHLLTRPAGVFSVHRATNPSPSVSTTAKLEGVIHPQPPCTWWQIEASGQLSTRVCWITAYGVPSQVWSQTPNGWQRTFLLEDAITGPIPSEVFATDLSGFQVRSADEMQADD